jgi:hypothetical protein
MSMFLESSSMVSNLVAIMYWLRLLLLHVNNGVCQAKIVVAGLIGMCLTRKFYSNWF